MKTVEQTISPRTIGRQLTVLGITHAVVDATCAGLLFAMLLIDQGLDKGFYFLVLTYNVLAFGLQPMCGRLVDNWQRPKFAAVLGCGITAGSLLWLGISPMGAVCLAGIGNAFFHVGAGSISLSLTPGRAMAPGIFVAPGAIGLAVGIAVGKAGFFVPWQFGVLLVACGIGIIAHETISVSYSREPAPESFSIFGFVLVLLFVSIVIRSLIGMTVQLPWKAEPMLLVCLTLLVAAGKAFGGFLADRYGWSKVAVTALVVSAPLIAFGHVTPVLGLTGMFLFNMTMAVTLVAIACVFPGRPGFAFGLPCLALLMGALPSFTPYRSALNDPWLTLFVILGSAVALFGGLRLLLSPSRNGRKTLAFRRRL